MNFLGIGLLLLQVQTAAVDGTVTKPGGNEPLARATVQLVGLAAGQATQKYTARTQDDGRFTLSAVEPGDYLLTAESVRYGRVTYGQRRTGGPGAVLSLGAGQQVSGLRMAMDLSGTITGRVLGRNGQPAIQASVQALRYEYSDGRRVLVAAQATRTDDRGEYRLYWLPAGRYVVAAAPNVTLPEIQSSGPLFRDMGNAGLGIIGTLQASEDLLRASVVSRVLEDGTVREEAWGPVYYPATEEPRLATLLAVAAGATVNGIDLSLAPTRVQRVRGSISGLVVGSPPTVTLQPFDTMLGMRAPVVGKGASSADGSFAFEGVLPGRYYLVARDVRTGYGSLPVAISVEDRDIEGVTLAMSRTVLLRGRVLVEGGTPTSALEPIFRDLALWIQPALPGLPLQNGIQVRTAEDGSFAVELPPGDYQLRFNTAEPEFGDLPSRQLKSVRFAGTEALDGFRVTGTPDGLLEITLTTETGSVQGSVRDPQGGTAPGTTVVLVPDAGRRQTSRYKVVVAGADGTFRLPGVAAGNYKIFAWSDVETGVWQDPEFLRSYETKGRAVQVLSKAQSTVQLEVLDSRQP